MNMNKVIYRNGGGGYGNLKANNGHTKGALMGAYTASALAQCGIVVLKGNEYFATGRGVSPKTLEGIIGASAYGYWVRDKKWLAVQDGRVRAAKGAIDTLNARYSGTGPTFNNNRAALQLVSQCMRIGGDGGINYQPNRYEIKD